MNKLVKILLLPVLSIIIVGCNEETKNMTVYDYLTNKPLLDKDFNDCISGKENNIQKCEIVKSAYNKYSFFKKGLYSESDLKQFGKK